MNNIIQNGIEVVDRIDTVKTRLKNQKLDRQTRKVYAEKFKKLKVISGKLLDKVIELRSIEKTQMEMHDIDCYETCDICLEEYQLDNGVMCHKCRQIVCMKCYSKVDKCPFCRNVLDTVKPVKPTENTDWPNISQHRLAELIQLVYINRTDTSLSLEMISEMVMDAIFEIYNA